MPVVCLRARLLNFHWQSWGLIVESCSRQNHLRGIEAGIQPVSEIAHTNKSIRRYGKATLLSGSRSN